VLYLAIPAHNEVATIGVLLWRLRTVLAEFPREYEVVVYDDASTDETAEVAAQYERAMPVTLLRGRKRLGYAGSVDALLRHVASSTRYPRRDAVLLMQGDFTDPPGIVPEFARRFEGGADLVVGERLTVADAPSAVKRLFKYGHWAMRPFVKLGGVSDLTASMRLVRISALREAIRLAGNAPLLSGDSWTANADLLLRLAPFARRVENVPMEPTFGVRMRETRRVAMADTIGMLKWAWAARGRRAVVGSSPAESGPDDRRGGRPSGRRREEPELSVERLRQKVRERDGSTGIDGERPDPRRGRRRREAPPAERTESTERQERASRPPRGERPERPEHAERAERGARAERAPREKTRAPRAERAPREARAPREPRAPLNDPTLPLDDPFAPPPSRREPRTSDEAITASPVERTPYRLPPMDQDDDDTEPMRPVVEPPAAGESDDTDGAADDSGETSEAGQGGEDGEGESPRKRRRNRRSRRGRRKKSPTGVDGEPTFEHQGSDAGEETGDESGTESGTDLPAARERVRFTPADHIDGEPVAGPRADAADADDEGDDDGDDDVAGTERMSDSISDGSPRPRRRGRRGRRGGARRSKGRKERDPGDAPPPEPE
jgi:hypothetical protein